MPMYTFRSPSATMKYLVGKCTKICQKRKRQWPWCHEMYFHICPMSKFPSYLDPLRYSSNFLQKEPNGLLDGKDDGHHKPNNIQKSKNILKNVKQDSFVSN